MLVNFKQSISTQSRRTVLIVCAILAILVSIMLVLQRLALAGSSQRFGLFIVQDAQLAPTNTSFGKQAAAPVAIEQEAPPASSLAEAQQSVSFVIPQPSWLPDHLSLLGARVGSGPTSDNYVAPIQVILTYGRANAAASGSTIGVSLDIFSQPAIRGGISVPKSMVKDITINGQPAVFVNGAYDENGLWDQSAHFAMVSWADARFTYVLSTSEYPEIVNEDDLIRIAASVK